MVEMSTSECAIQIAEKHKRGFKPLTSGQLLLKTRHNAELHQRALLIDDDDQDEEDMDDVGRECFLSKFLATSMTLLVCVFIYFVVLQHWLLTS
ncbi:hypothetical protein P3T76_012679 [Phytophthora citrophthora]|uniref:Uncharacterized protein n=1 Tax=Phytophthora citrophthora TaxID=4793 RepID=A0AAD9LDL1_9STRA|nr:hypothetical protein P3T76_012679 [Phytophthora citrophthora]